MESGRKGRNREALLGAGRSLGHAFSAHELHERAPRDQPRLGLTTACRAIERWRDEGREAAAAVGFALSDRALASLPGRCSRCAAR
jgi:hypothetical protein